MFINNPELKEITNQKDLVFIITESKLNFVDLSGSEKQ